MDFFHKDSDNDSGEDSVEDSDEEKDSVKKERECERKIRVMSLKTLRETSQVVPVQPSRKSMDG